MKFLLIIILQEPKEFGVTTSHMLLVVVATNVHTFFTVFSLQAPNPTPKIRYISNFYHPCCVRNSKPQTAVFVVYLILGVVGDGTN
jgi:hypothetical protein